MHKLTLSAEFRESLRQRRDGREHVFDVIEPKETALLVIDMQNAFVAPGALLEVPAARGIVANINRLADSLRKIGSLVVWVRSTFSKNGRAGFRLYFDHFAPGTSGEEIRDDLSEGSNGHAFWHELNRHNDDLVVDKDRFSAFINGASDLEKTLLANGIDTLAVAGTLTNVCCESTVRDAMMRDFKCIMVEDANAAQTDEEHLTALENVARVFGDVMMTDEFLQKMREHSD